MVHRSLGSVEVLALVTHVRRPEGRQRKVVQRDAACPFEADFARAEANASRPVWLPAIESPPTGRRSLAETLQREQLLKLARAGAETMVKQLRAEIVAIERTFPELAMAPQRRAVTQAIATAEAKTRRMSAAARKAVSARMKKYWAERRKAKAKVK